MIHLLDDIPIHCNFKAICTERGKYVPGTLREGHNVFTSTGRDWLSRLVVWATLGSPDVPRTNARVRWMGVGTGTTQLEQEDVDSLETPIKVDALNYIAVIDGHDFPAAKRVRFIKIFGTNDLSQGGPPIPVTEAGMYVDVNPAAAPAVVDDVPWAPGEPTILNPEVGTNPPIAYKTFDPINKTNDFNLEITWTLIFG